jgi:probable phosphoglycerate mutase
MLEGHADPPLAPEGERQAQALAERLVARPPAALFVSTLRRTSQTAAPLVERIGVQPVVIPDLREVNLGEWEGGELRIRAANGDPLVGEMMAAERWDVIPGAEPMDDFAARVSGGLDAVVAAAEPGTTVAAFVHGGVIGELCRQATNSRPFAFVFSDNASITRLIVLADGRRMLRGFNDTAHLAGLANA